MKATMDEVFEAIRRERAYQDAKWGTIEQNPHDGRRWLRFVEEEVNEAWCAISCAGTCRELLQAASVIVGCLEQHGIVERDTEGR